MTTRKIKDAKDLSTQELIYFKGHAKATFMSDGATVEDAVNDKQDVLISGTNIKTINGESILGSGNIEVSSGGPSYDDTELNNKLNGLQTQIDTLVSGDASAAIESFNEITAFLNGVEDTESLDGIIAGIEQQITNKQDTIADLETIRSGAALGATALQEHQDISHLATKEELTSLTNEMIANEEVHAAAYNELNERVNEISENVSGETATKVELQDAVTSLTNTILENEEISASAFNDINDRMSSCATLSDLDAKQDTLVSGTNIKTINNQSLLGSGNINIEGGGGGGVAELMTETTWADLVALRDAGNLVAGMKYRITDYETKTSKAGSQSAGHLFDIIVTALDGSTLDEKASAIQSARDTDGYFANSNLASWDVRYCLDNDTDRFDWAVKAGTILTVDLSELGASSVQATPNGTFEYEGTTYYRWDANIMGIAIYVLTANASPAVGESTLMYMIEHSAVIGNAPVVSLTESTDNGFGVVYSLIDEQQNDVPYDFKNIQFVRKITDGALDLENGADTWCYTFSDFSTGALLDASESGSTIFQNKFSANCWDNVFIGNNSYSNTFGNQCYSNTFGTTCHSNTFGNQCYSNTFGTTCHSNTFGNQCAFQTFGNECAFQTFGNNCYSNTFGNQCGSNTFGTGCEYNTFGNECGDNTFDDYCRNNTFGNSCRSNTFNDYCRVNTFGADCSYNTFGNACDSNTFGNACDSNTFGNFCQYNTFATASDGSELSNICCYNTLGHNCVYNIIWSAWGPIRRIEIKSGISGTESAKRAIEIPVANAVYVQTIAKNSSGDIKIYCEADLVPQTE